MNSRTLSRPTRALALAAGIASLAGPAGAQTAIALTPNLKALPASSISLVTNSSGALKLRFSTTSWNGGAGPLELVAGDIDTNGKQRVWQRVYSSDGRSTLTLAGSFTYHADHDHIHFDDYATYSLQPVNAPGGSQRTGVKTTFCVMDTTAVNTSLPGAPQSAAYATCGRVMQGMSVGWGDTYGAHLSGQEIDFTNNADGVYALRIKIDPKELIQESNNGDNESCVLLSIRKPSTALVLDSSGSCSSVVSISPSTAQVGTTVQVTVSGYGFTQGMGLTFEGGHGPRPVAGNVQLVSDTAGLDMITATVTVPFKKQPSRDPVWDVRVGSGGVLRNAFTVTR